MALVNKNIFEITGISLPEDACVVIVRTAWNEPIVNKLEQGCADVLKKQNVPYKIITVPGAIEIPFAIHTYWAHSVDGFVQKPSAFIALGCVILGDTPHFEYVCRSVTDGITRLNTSLPVPSVFGVLTVNNQAQADERTGGVHGHKGEEAAATAIKMMQLNASFKNEYPTL